MKKVLYIDCCIRRENSRSKELAEFFIDQLEKTENTLWNGCA